MKIGAITIGQSPRKDITDDVVKILPKNYQLIECGALDGYSYQEIINKFKPEEEDELLVTRLRDGQEVELAKNKIIKEVDKCIDKLEKENCKYIVLFCTGNMNLKSKNTPLILPNDYLRQIVVDIAGSQKIAVLVPHHDQIKTIKVPWQKLEVQAEFFACSPYGELRNFKKVLGYIKKQDFALVYLDCIGYSIKMQSILVRELNLPVILPRTMIMRCIALL